MSAPEASRHPSCSGRFEFVRFCQDVLRSSSVENQPFFDPARVRALMDKISAKAPSERAAFEGVVLRVVSTCLLQERFGLAA